MSKGDLTKNEVGDKKYDPFKFGFYFRQIMIYLILPNFKIKKSTIKKPPI